MAGADFEGLSEQATLALVRRLLEVSLVASQPNKLFPAWMETNKKTGRIFRPRRPPGGRTRDG